MIAAPADGPVCELEDRPPRAWPGTAAEWRVARRVADGLSATRIAALLGVSFHTVDTHIRRMANRATATGTRRERVLALVQALTSER